LEVLIAVSKDARDDHLAHLPALRQGPCRVEVIPNGIDLQRYEDRPTSGTLRTDLGLAQGVTLLGFLGRFMPQKGFLHLVEALSAVAREPHVPSFHLLAVGSGDFVREYKAEVDRRHELRGRITFREHVSNPAPILQELDLLVIPSLWEACPILPMEALVCGIPVLGSDCIGLREVLRDSPARMVPANDAPALAKAVIQAIASPWKESAVGGICAAQQRFDVRQRAQELLAVFNDCLRVPAGKRAPAVEPRLTRSEAT
jgi:glycosyltransferase involved in cell wall biosynthesis